MASSRRISIFTMHSFPCPTWAPSLCSFAGRGKARPLRRKKQGSNLALPPRKTADLLDLPGQTRAHTLRGTAQARKSRDCLGPTRVAPRRRRPFFEGGGVSPTVPASEAVQAAYIAAGPPGAGPHDNACTRPPAAACRRRRRTRPGRAGPVGAAHGGQCLPGNRHRAACTPGTRCCPGPGRPGVGVATRSRSRTHAPGLHPAAREAPPACRLKQPCAPSSPWARPHGSGLSPPGKQKRRSPQPPSRASLWAPAFYALASCNIPDGRSRQKKKRRKPQLPFSGFVTGSGVLRSGLCRYAG